MVSAGNMAFGWLASGGSSGGGGGGGTVTSFSAGDLSPLFTTNVATATTTPALSFILTDQAPNTVFAGPIAGPDDAAPTFRALVAADIPTEAVLLSRLGAAAATNSIDNVNFAQTWAWNSLTTQTAFTISSSSISSGTLWNIAVNTTAAASNTLTALLVTTQGANVNSTQTTYAARFSNTHTGTSSTNVAAQFIASGGTNNTAILANVGGTVGSSTLYSTITVQEDSLGGSATSVKGIALVNPTAAAAGAQQYSPSIIFRAQGWSTNSGGASNTLDWRMYASATQGSSIASSVLNLGLSYNGAAFTEYFTFSFGAVATFTAPNISMGGSGQFLSASSGAPNSDFAAFGQGVASSADTKFTFAGAANVTSRSVMGGTIQGIPASNSYASHIIGASPITEASAGTHALISSLVIKAQTITGGVATVTNTATLYIESEATCTVTGANYAMWVASGQSRFDGNILFAAGTTTVAPATFQTGSLLSSPTAGSWGYSTPGLYFTNGTAVRQQVVLSQMTRVSGSNFSVSNDTLTNVTGLTANVAAGATYDFEIIIYGTCDIAGGMQIALAGTCTATSIIYQGQFGEAGGNVQYAPRATALGTGIAMGSGSTAPYLRITGTITVNAAGTLTVQMAEEVTTATATVLIGSTFKVTQLN